MCIPWSDEDWLNRSQPASPTSKYTLKDTRYNEYGEAARTYREDDGWFYAVLPGTGNRAVLEPDEWPNPSEAALLYLTQNGFTLMEPPTPAPAEPDPVAALALGARDLVENIA